MSGGSYPWCAVFVSWCANQAGVPTSVIPKTASVSTLHSFFQGAGLFQPKGNGYKPKAGDILIQKSNGASHTGIVTGSSGGSFTTIEGNTSNGVYQRSYSLNDSKLTGFGTPNYSGAPLTGSGGNLIGDSTDNTDFNPHPRKGRDVLTHAISLGLAGISIHTPARGVTTAVALGIMANSGVFQSTLPQGE